MKGKEERPAPTLSHGSQHNTMSTSNMSQAKPAHKTREPTAHQQVTEITNEETSSAISPAAHQQVNERGQAKPTQNTGAVHDGGAAVSKVDQDHSSLPAAPVVVLPLSMFVSPPVSDQRE